MICGVRVLVSQLRPTCERVVRGQAQPLGGHGLCRHILASTDWGKQHAYSPTPLSLQPPNQGDTDSTEVKSYGTYRESRGQVCVGGQSSFWCGSFSRTAAPHAPELASTVWSTHETCLHVRCRLLHTQRQEDTRV